MCGAAADDGVDGFPPCPVFWRGPVVRDGECAASTSVDSAGSEFDELGAAGDDGCDDLLALQALAGIGMVFSKRVYLDQRLFAEKIEGCGRIYDEMGVCGRREHSDGDSPEAGMGMYVGRNISAKYLLVLVSLGFKTAALKRALKPKKRR